ncbi:hypothetical protein EUX50_02380 [Haemophilus haemolyticus]|uniref:Uncharacterized protein n=1 Tax=Haemophilus haemolyticus TaxID=726 RepID=A0ABY2YQS1_HAEHA|nr:hypothetical protein [Haemophilus haemolyticus]TPH07180.1 hypothetical protein EUX50_02380 [Haemophilus haemolyticus]
MNSIYINYVKIHHRNQRSESITPETPYHGCFWSLTALCDDGTLWNKSSIKEPWEQIPNVPQDNEEQTKAAK